MIDSGIEIGARQRLARIVTDVLAPANVLAVLLLVIGWHSGGVSGVAWAVGAACVAVGIPLVVVLLGVRAGRYTDVHVRVRTQRAVPITVAVVCALATIVLLRVLGAPSALGALVAAIAAGLAVGGLITVWWKVSGHTAVAGAATVVLTVSYGPVLLSVLVLAALVAWSRVVLADHTIAQTCVGFLVGAGTALAVFVPLR